MNTKQKERKLFDAIKDIFFKERKEGRKEEKRETERERRVGNLEKKEDDNCCLFPILNPLLIKNNVKCIAKT